MAEFDNGPEAASKAILEVPVEDWHSIYATNVFAYYYCSGAFLPLLHAATKSEYGLSGCIVNTCSMSGITPNSQNG